eukprot:Sspe_Gene.45754::Locus_22722_Transcript_1_1_Confidence_1.000_Length_455::g.45754::m.45754
MLAPLRWPLQGGAQGSNRDPMSHTQSAPLFVCGGGGRGLNKKGNQVRSQGGSPTPSTSPCRAQPEQPDFTRPFGLPSPSLSLTCPSLSFPLLPPLPPNPRQGSKEERARSPSPPPP